MPLKVKIGAVTFPDIVLQRLERENGMLTPKMLRRYVRDSLTEGFNTIISEELAAKLPPPVVDLDAAKIEKT